MSKIIKIKECYLCPLNTIVNSINFCNHIKYFKTSGRIFNELDDNKKFPDWCPLPVFIKK